MTIGRKFWFQTSHTKFSMGFVVLLYAICNALNIDKLAKWFRDKDGLDFSALSAFLLGGLCLFMVVSPSWPTAERSSHWRSCSRLSVPRLPTSSPNTTSPSTVDGPEHDSQDSTEVGQLLSLQMSPYVIFLMLFPRDHLDIDITFAPSGRYLLASLGTRFDFIVRGPRIPVLAVQRHSSGWQCIEQIHRVFARSDQRHCRTASVASKSIRNLMRSNSKDVEISARVSSPGNLVVVLAIGDRPERRTSVVYGYDRRNTSPDLQKTVVSTCWMESRRAVQQSSTA